MDLSLVLQGQESNLHLNLMRVMSYLFSTLRYLNPASLCRRARIVFTYKSMQNIIRTSTIHYYMQTIQINHACCRSRHDFD